MDLAAPQRIFGHGTDVGVLLVLAAASEPLSGREVATRAGCSEAGARVALDRLVRQGVVQRVTVGRSYAHRLNRRHVALPAIEALAGMRRQVIDAARAVAGGWAIAPVHASLFGSFARREGGVDSDLDVLLVHPDDLEDDAERRWEQQAAELRDLEELCGNPVQILDLAASDVARANREEQGTLERIAAEGILLSGQRLTRLMDRRPARTA